MNKILLFCLLFATSAAFCQEDAWVYFTDKPNAQFYFDNPLQMLSQRALDRREVQNIALDFADIPMSQDYIDQVEAVPTISVMAKSKWLNAVHVRGNTAAINSLTSQPFVASVDFADNSLDQQGKTRPKLATTIKTATTHIEFPYGQSANQIEMLNGHLLHQQDFTGNGKVIAVMDAGFPQVDVIQPFQRLWDNNKILGGYNFVDRNTNIFTRNSHGTLVLSTMGGYTEGQLVGTAPDASYYLFITEDTGSENPIEESNWVEAAEMADSLGVDVINTSLGYFNYDDPAYSYSYEDLDGLTSFSSRGAQIAFSRGMFIVVSAGNSGTSEDPYVSVPADAENILTVGAVNSEGIYVPFSSIGPTPDGRIKPDVMAKGQAAVISNTQGTIVTGNGTSFAGPIMAGMVASLWQALPDKTNYEILQIIRESAHLYTNPNPQYGYGIPDFAEALENALSTTTFATLPNPVTRFLTIDFPAGVSSAEVTIYSIKGARVFDKIISVNEPAADLESLSNGIYIYRIRSGSLSSTGKFIKQ